MRYEDQYQMFIENSFNRSLFSKALNLDNENDSLYAKEFLKTLYENVVYNEEIEIDENDKYSTRFANKLISINKDCIKNILENTAAKFRSNSKIETIKEEAKNSALSMIKIMFENSSLQMNEVEELAQRFGNNTEKISNLSSLFKEYNILTECKNSNDNSLKSMLLSTMTESDQLKLALRVDTFKSILSSVGIDVNRNDNKKLVDEEFEKNLF